MAPITRRKIEADDCRASLQLVARVAALFALSEGERALPAEPEASAGALPAQPSPRPPDDRRHTLPAQASTLIGHEREVAELCALLRQPGIRLVTLIDPPLKPPDLRTLAASGPDLARIVGEYEAVRLFVERARGARADFSLDEPSLLCGAAWLLIQLLGVLGAF